MLLALALLLTGSSAMADRQLVWLRGWDGRGRPFDLASTRGRVVALTFCSRWTKDEAARVNDLLLSRAGAEVEIVTVVDFAGVPSFAHDYARRKIAEHDQQGRLVHLVDEQGRLKRSFQTDPERRVDILVIDREGSLRGRFFGEGQVQDALKMVDQLRAPATATATM